ncbi:MAG: hypothetical protein PWQ87_78, partial [Candidatus Woesearchaeota archaeon]|nr:hypothetical protein [Candidatus Woesearchaeota archaeon]
MTLKSKFNEVAKGNFGKLRAEHFSFIRCEKMVEQREKHSILTSYESAFCFLIKECIPQPKRKPITPKNKNRNIIGKKSVLNLEKFMCVLGNQNNEDIPINNPIQLPNILKGSYDFFIL